MPQFKWRGVTLDGTWHKGHSFALSSTQLDEQLFRRGIACTYVAQYSPWMLRKSVSYDQQINLFNRLAVLLQAGIRLPDAWLLVVHYTSNIYLQEYLYSIGIQLQNGVSLPDALTKSSCPFNAMTIALLQVGYESGKLAETTLAIAQYLTTVQAFYKNMRHALYIPLITLCFVLLLVLGIFVYVLPYLVGLFASFNTQVPHATLVLMRISTYIRSWYSIGIMIGGIVISSIIRYYIHYFPYCKHYWDSLTIHIPGIGIIIKEWYVACTMRALGTLIESNMTLTQALITIQPMIHNHLILHEWIRVTQLVQAGSSLSDALSTTHHTIFESDLIAMVAVGEESNKLPDFLYKIATIYHERLINRLNRVSSLMQPIAIIILGIIVMILIIAVYMPIIQMAQHIQ